MGENKKIEVKGIKVRVLNGIIIGLVSILCIFTIITSFRLSKKYAKYIHSSDVFFACSEAANSFTQGSNYLTQMAGYFVSNMNVLYIYNYFNELENERSRETSFEVIKKSSVDKYVVENFKTAIEESTELSRYEIYAMKLIAETSVFKGTGQKLPSQMERYALSDEDALLSDQAKINKARELVFGDGYYELKRMINNHNTLAISNLLSDSELKRRKSASLLEKLLKQDRIALAIILVLNIASYIIIMMLLVGPLREVILKISSGQKLDSIGAYEFKYLAATYNQLLEKNQANENLLKFKAEHDGLTGLINRGAFTHMTNVLSYSDDSLAMLLIDVDKFKEVNDTYGHIAGDEVLKKVARVLSEYFRTTDYVARIGGDEFSVLMPNPGDNACKLIAGKLRFIGEVLAKSEGDVPAVTLSVGVSISQKGYNDVLYEDADKALYYVKRNGRNNFAYYDAEKNKFYNSSLEELIEEPEEDL